LADFLSIILHQKNQIMLLLNSQYLYYIAICVMKKIFKVAVRGHPTSTVLAEITHSYSGSTGTRAVRVPHAQKKQKRDKNRAPRAFFFPFMGFVAPYWQSELPPQNYFL
jgi:hypothetical protein